MFYEDLELQREYLLYKIVLSLWFLCYTLYSWALILN